ncbi:hypothetical protein HPB47_018582 [Ixodes persulcatus]|uniref:Uncharacterized protein n=1 Tax=Ixodes persulcatus TaxID=34615 RepID=A0AC60QL68_IXOPE|nr:hypothetical protein HPB47_018582 [Ixodes persulcatus]
MSEQERERMTLRSGATLEGPTPPPAPDPILERVATLCDAAICSGLPRLPTEFWTPRRSLVAIGTLPPSYRFQPAPTRPTEHIATWTALTLDGSAVGWWSRLAWDDQPQVPMGTPAGQVPEPFRRLTITDRHPTEPRPHYAPEERALLCEVCGVPEIHWSHTSGRPAPPRARTSRPRAAHVPQDADLDAALNLLRRLRPHLLRESDDVIFEDDDA